MAKGKRDSQPAKSQPSSKEKPSQPAQQSADKNPPPAAAQTPSAAAQTPAPSGADSKAETAKPTQDAPAASTASATPKENKASTSVPSSARQASAKDADKSTTKDSDDSSKSDKSKVGAKADNKTTEDKSAAKKPTETKLTEEKTAEKKTAEKKPTDTKENVAAAAAAARATEPPKQGRSWTRVLLLIILFLLGVAVWPVFGSYIQQYLPDGLKQALTTETSPVRLAEDIAQMKASIETLRVAAEGNTESVQTVQDQQQTAAEERQRLVLETDQLKEDIATVLASGSAAGAVAEDVAALDAEVEGIAAKLPALEALAAANVPDRLAALEQNTEQGGGQSDNTAALQQELAALSEQVAALSTETPSTENGDRDASEAFAAALAALETRIGTTEEALTALAGAAPAETTAQQTAKTTAEGAEDAGKTDADIPASAAVMLTGRLQTLEEQLAASQAALSDAQAALENQVAELNDQRIDPKTVATLQETVARLSEQQQSNAAQEQVSGLEGQLSEQSQQVAGLSDGLTQITGRLTEAEQQIATMAQLQAELADLGQRVNDVGSQLQAAAAADQSAEALVLAVGQMTENARAGTDFSGPLATVRQLAGDDAGLAPALADLEAVQAGLPSLATLQSAFAEAAAGISRAPPADATGTPWLDSALNRLSGLVKIQHTGEAGGSSTGAILARAEAALAAGNIDGAAAEVGALEGDALAAMQPWLTQVAQRQAAEAALKSVQATAIARLGERG